MNPKITRDHLARTAMVYVRQSTPTQVAQHTESKRRQYALADTARTMGFRVVETIDDDLGRSGSGLEERPGFQKLVGRVCSAAVGAVFCIEASRLARNGRDWHHLIDLCALVGTLVIDPDGVYDPRLLNDRLLLGLKGTMSEYELSLLRQRGLAARDAKARRGELRVGLPPGYCWNELGKVEIDPDERVANAIHTIFRKFRELGSARQVLLWARDADVQVPVIRSGSGGTRVDWRTPAYHNILLVLTNPTYAGAYVFGRTENRIRLEEGRARKTGGHKKPRERWTVLLQDHHPGFVSWDEFEHNQRMLQENAHMAKRASRKSGRGGRALLTGLMRCGRCGRMLHVFYGSRSGHAHRYQCRGDQVGMSRNRCLGIGGVRVDRAVSAELLHVVKPHAVEAATQAAASITEREQQQRRALILELEEARYEAALAGRRHAAVDPDKRLVARELESRWEAALARVRQLEERVMDHDARVASAEPTVDLPSLLRLARDLHAVWNAPSTDMRIKQRIVRALVREVVVNQDVAKHEVTLAIHWVGGRHTEVRIARVRRGRYPVDRRPNAVDAIRRLGGHWSDRELAVTLNRMRCRSEDGGSWTTVRVRALRERLGIAAFDPTLERPEMISANEASRRLSICIGSVHRLIREGVLPASQLMPSAPWQIPVSALDTEAVRIGVRRIIERRPRNFAHLQDKKTLRLPGI